MPRFVIIDGNAILHRAFHALPPLTTKKGLLVNALYGFITLFLKMRKDLRPEYLVVTFDRRAPTFRDELYKDYKAQRVKQPQELYDQISLIKEFLSAWQVPIYELDGFEADDVIGTLSREAKNVEVVIVTGDLDTLQLVNGHTKVYTLKKGLSDTFMYDETAVKERYGLVPNQLIDYKALRGDPSDNIPGVKGVGEKTASELLQKFSTLENMYETLEKGSVPQVTERVRKLLLDGKEMALLSKKLVTIACDAPIKFSLAETSVKLYDRERVIALFQEWEFASLVNRLPIDDNYVIPAPHPGAGQAPAGIHNKEMDPRRGEDDGYRVRIKIKDGADLNLLVARAREQNSLVVQAVADGPTGRTAKLHGLGIGWGKEAAFIPAKFLDHEGLRALLANENIIKYGHDLKYTVETLHASCFMLHGLGFDTMIASYLLNPGSRGHDLDTLRFTILKSYKEQANKASGKQVALLDMVSDEERAEKSGETVRAIWELVQRLVPRLEEAVLSGLFHKIEMPLVPVLAKIEEAGVKIDKKLLDRLSERTVQKLDELTAKIWKLAGVEFNVNSSVQLKEILFERLKLSVAGIAKGKTGISTAASELEKLRELHPIIPLIEEYRELAKLQSTYLKALPQLIDQKTGRVHTSYNQTVAATGRLSSSDPNLQNIPVRTELGNEVRKSFIAEKRKILLAADYSQIELRVVASLASDGAMIASFKNGEDIHRRTAATMNGLGMEEVTHEMRYAAKATNFGVIYGMGATSLAASTGLSRIKAKEYIEKYFEVHAGIKKYLDGVKEQARDLGYVETLFGRRRYLPEINAEHPMLRAGAERAAINHPVQGTAADLLKLAMIEIDKKLDPKIAKMIMQVHDELVFEVTKGKEQEVAEIVRQIMENIYTLKVPIEVHVEIGENWGEMRST